MNELNDLKRILENEMPTHIDWTGAFDALLQKQAQQSERISELLRFNNEFEAQARIARASLKMAIDHIEHMASWIGDQKAGYTFESLGEDMPGMRAALTRPYPDVLASIEAWLICEALRADEGSGVELFCDNPDFNGQPNNAIECCGDWTGWDPTRFTGNTIVEALRNAHQAMIAAKVP